MYSKLFLNNLFNMQKELAFNGSQTVLLKGKSFV